jgi:hypothetical protein
MPGAKRGGAGPGPFRYAIYYVPGQGSELYRLGSSLLGRCLREGRAVPFPSSFPKALEAFSGQGNKDHFSKMAATYGFHATVIAPFRPRVALGELAAWLGARLSPHRPFRLPGLALSRLRGFPVLESQPLPQAFRDLEAGLLEGLGDVALPPDPRDLARRGALTGRQLANFREYGYPFVREEYRFHLTLGDPLGDPRADEAYLSFLKDYLGPEALEGPLLEGLTLCAQESPGGWFAAVGDFPLGGGAIDAKEPTWKRD